LLLARVRSSRRPEEAPADTRAAFVSRITDPGWRRRVPPGFGGRGGRRVRRVRARRGRRREKAPADTRRTRPAGYPRRRRWVRPAAVRAFVGRRWRLHVPRGFGEEWGFAAERLAEVRGEFGEGASRVRPMVRVRVADEPAPVDDGVSGFDDHVGGRGDVADGGRAGETLGKMELHGDVVLDALVVDGYGAVRAEELDGAPVVVREGVVAHAQGGVTLRDGERGGNESRGVR